MMKNHLQTHRSLWLLALVTLVTVVLWRWPMDLEPAQKSSTQPREEQLQSVEIDSHLLPCGCESHEAGVKITTKFVEITSGTEELDFDWVLEPFGTPSSEDDASVKSSDL